MKSIIITVGPSFFSKVNLKEIHQDNFIYRINGAHGELKSIESYINKVKSQIPVAKILVDIPGNKIRVQNLEYGFIEIEKNKNFELYFHQFNFENFYKYLQPKDIILANDSIFKFEVIDIDYKNKKIIFKSYSEGKLLNNKGFHIKNINDKLPFLFKRDKELINLVNKYQINYIGLSFIRNKKDILEAKNLIDPNINIISKIETSKAVENLEEILNEVEYILLDRGDLSADIGILNLPKYQKYILEKAVFSNKKVFLATQFLKSMENQPIPTFPEIIDLYNTLKSGIYGIQLSEETAIGKYPYECIKTVINVIENLKKEKLYEESFIR